MTRLQHSTRRASGTRRGTARARILHPWIVAVVVTAGCAEVAVAPLPPGPPTGPGVGAGAVATVVYAHDIHVDWIVATVIHAHDVHAPQLQYRQLILVKGDEGRGGQDIHGESLQAYEIHAHDIHARSIVVDTLYAHKVH